MTGADETRDDGTRGGGGTRLGKPWPRLLRDVARDAPARLLRDVETGVMAIPAGTLGTLRASGATWNGLTFEREACPCCGVRPFVRNLGKADLELLA